ncbi:MAG: hypothetical protein R3B60_02350 [Candidatus Paceibacterota bacterium]
MSPAFKNIITTLIILLLAAVGYYLYKQSNASVVTGENKYVTPEMIRDTRVFMERRMVLEKIDIDTSVFNDPLFVSYRNFTTPIQSQMEGKNNPFSENSGFTPTNNF